MTAHELPSLSASELSRHMEARDISCVELMQASLRMEVVTPFTLAGLPVASVPVGFNAGGLPMGMQIAGPARADASLLSIARTCEQHCPWTRWRRQAIAGRPTRA